MESVALFMCIALIIFGAIGTVAGVVHLYQDWWDMDSGDRFTDIMRLLFCIASVVVGFGPWY